MKTRRRIWILATVLAISFVALTSPHGSSADRQEAKRNLAQARFLRVGPKQELERPSDAARTARDGDVIEIESGVYEGDVAVWSQHRLTIRGVGGRPQLRANGVHAEGKGIWVVKGNDMLIEGIEFSGAKVPDRNGAGIRLEGTGLTVRRCYFHDNENGILSGANPASDIVVEHSEFERNGSGDGQSHNMYIGNVRSFTLRFSYVHHAVVGHNVKSRALKNYITYNRIMDETNGRSSYAVDLSNGGLAFLIGNVIQQGPQTENSTIVSYGAEGLTHPLNQLYFVHNTVVNDRPAGGRFLFVHPGADAVEVVNNVFAGRGEWLSGSGELRNNIAIERAYFIDPVNFDYRLRPGAPAIGRAVDPGSAFGLELRPDAEYVHKAQKRIRVNSRGLDVGAFAFRWEH